MRVSVIIPCFNQGAYLDEAVDSVLAQACQDLEILVVDDGSTDEATARLLARYSRPRTTVYRTPNRGLARARNFLLARATGQYLCALDADDRLHPQYFQKALACFDADPGLTFVSAWIQEFGERQQVWRQHRCDLAALLAEDTVMTAALVRREAVVAAGGYDEQMPAQGDEDWDLWIRLVRAGHRGTIIPEPLFYYRKRPGSMSTACTTGQAHLDLARYIFRKHADAYTECLHDVLLTKEDDISALLRENDRLEREIDGRLRHEIQWRRAELQSIRRKIATRRGAPGGVPPSGSSCDARVEPLAGGAGDASDPSYAYQVLDAEYRRAIDEIRALRASWSWRLTAPVRAAYEAWRPGGRRRR